ncbi:MAG: CoA-transferase [Streptosporangiaceae bacterium]|jgi:propionate CoA-transferase
MAKVIRADEVPALIPDGATMAVSGIVLSGFAEEVAIAVEQSFLAKGHPCGLTLMQGAGIGNAIPPVAPEDFAGIHHFGHEGLVAKWIGGHTGVAPNMAHLIEQNRCEAYCIPQGVVVQLYREIAAHRPGIITTVGLGTFLDPRLGGAKMNAATTADYVELVELGGKEYLLYKSFPIDVALIRGTTADERGNIAMDEEALLLEQLPLAQAAKNSGGIVIAQVKYLALAGSLHPKHVRVPAPLVDYVVVAAPEHHLQTGREQFSPVLSGDLKAPLESVPPLPMNERLVICRRAAMELMPGAVINLGYGIPDEIGSVAAQEEVTALFTLTTEVGAIGGWPGSGLDFGTSSNAEAFIEHQAMFDWYDGRGIDMAFLGLAQADRQGNVNVSRFSGRAVGIGGFVNVAHGSKAVIYCGSFTAGGLKVATGDGELHVVQEGKQKKFLEHVEEISFSGRYAADSGQRVLYVTERAVFELRDGDITLIEIAPGVNLERDVLGQMNFTPAVAADLALMPTEIFCEHWGKLRAIVEGRTPAGPGQPQT